MWAVRSLLLQDVAALAGTSGRVGWRGVDDGMVEREDASQERKGVHDDRCL